MEGIRAVVHAIVILMASIRLDDESLGIRVLGMRMGGNGLLDSL